MNKILFALIVLATGFSGYAERHLLLADSGSRQLHMVDIEEKSTVWGKDGIYCYDIHRLPNGNILYCDEQNKESGKSYVREMAPDGTFVWEYISEGEVPSCQRLNDGTTLVVECTNGRLVIVAQNGDVQKIIPLSFEKGGHGTVRWARQTLSGTYVAAHLADRCVREYDSDGKVLRTIQLPWEVFGVVPLTEGRLLVSGENGLMEFDRDNQVVWEFKSQDLPEVGVQWLTGIYVRENGHILVCNWLGHGKEGQGIPVFELDQNKHLIWSLPSTIQTKWIAALAE